CEATRRAATDASERHTADRQERTTQHVFTSGLIWSRRFLRHESPTHMLISSFLPNRSHFLAQEMLNARLTSKYDFATFGHVGLSWVCGKTNVFWIGFELL